MSHIRANAIKRSAGPQDQASTVVKKLRMNKAKGEAAALYEYFNIWGKFGINFKLEHILYSSMTLLISCCIVHFKIYFN